MQFFPIFFIRSKKLKTLAAATAYFSLSLIILVAVCVQPDHQHALFYATDMQHTNSWLSWIVSFISSLLLFVFGSSIVMAIPLCIFLANMRLRNISFASISARIIGAGITVCACAGLGTWYKTKLIMHNFQPGGLIGAFVVKIIKALDPAIVGLALYGFLFMGFVVWTNVSFIRMLHIINPLASFITVVYASFLTICKSFYKTIIVSCGYAQKTYENLPGTIQPEEQINPLQLPMEIIAQSIWSGTNKSQLQSSIIAQTLNEKVSHAFILPNTDLFEHMQPKTETKPHVQQDLAAVLEQKLQRFGVSGRVISIKVGPVVTLFEYQPDIDSKISKIIALEDDLALALQALSIRIIAPIPGKSVVGFEVSNKMRAPVHFSTLMHSVEFQNVTATLPLILGVDTVGNTVLADLATMPHLLLAGATGSGKSVGLNTMLCSLLCKCSPDELRIILIDPKRLEFAAYADIPHLLFPIVTQAKHAASILKWVLNTMQQRYELLSRSGVRNISDYFKLPVNRQEEKLYRIVVIIDELADLMMLVGREIEESIARIAQMARAAGIHLIVATQRPSVDVITGTIKVNFPCRLSCRVVSKVDSRTILDVSGADKLLGKGDMLYLDGANPIRRIHGAYISDEQIADLVQFWKQQQVAQYIDEQEVIDSVDTQLDPADEQLFAEILEFLQTVDDVSISLLQRRFKIGYNRSARIIEMLEAQGRILSIDGGKTRKVLK
jgi:DNA segregation ATPase FtsK/SpoIIIE-like protein